MFFRKCSGHKKYTENSQNGFGLNPLMLAAAISSLNILAESFRQRYYVFEEKVFGILRLLLPNLANTK